MAKTNVLNTGIVNFGDIIGNGNIYRVPSYQRDYSWEEEQWDDLWQDILNLQPSKTKGRYHYMGAIVLQDGDNEKEFVIIDGQQRLVTLSIIAIAIIAHIKQLQENGIDTQANEERTALLRSDYLGRKNPGSLFYSSKLFLNENNDNFYQSHLLQFKAPINPKALNDSDRLLWQAYHYFFSKLSNLAYLKSGRDFSDFLTEIVARQLLFIQINVEDEVNAYTVFETLNARGIELTATDLLKNYLFSLIKSKTDLKHIQKQWSTLSDTVSIKKMPEFIRAYINSKQNLIRKDGLFKAIKTQFETNNIAPPSDREADVIALLNELETFAYFYQALSQPSHDLWRVDDSSAKAIRNAIKVINLFNIEQIYPLLFAAYAKFYTASPDKFCKVLNICVVILFRYHIIGGKNPNELERCYNEAAIKLNDGSIKSPKQIFSILKRVYIEDAVFINDFSYKIIKTNTNKHLVRYILFELEREISGHGYDFEDDPATIEHILPENPAEIWEEAFSYQEQEKAVYRLGNYALLEQPINREIKNKSYAEKQPCYRKSQYQLTQAIQSLEWTTNSLQNRQEYMAKIAAQVWVIDYAS